MEDSNNRVVATEEEKLKVAHSLYSAYLAGQISGEDYQERYSSLMATVYVDEALSFLNGIVTDLPSEQLATGVAGKHLAPLSPGQEGRQETQDIQGKERELDPVDIALLMRQSSQTGSKNDYRWITVAATIIFIILLLLLGIMLVSRTHPTTGGAPSFVPAAHQVVFIKPVR